MQIRKRQENGENFMNKKLYRYFIETRAHHNLRRDFPQELAAEFSALGLSPEERMVRRFELLCREEKPQIQPFEKIVLMRTIKKQPEIFTEAEWADIKAKHYIHELGFVSNLSLDYGRVIGSGLLAVRENADAYGRRVIDAIIDLCDRYKRLAVEQDRRDVVEVLSRVPRYGATNFREALQMFRILHYALWLEGDYHNTVGRFDQYIYPYFKRDMDAGVYTKETALDLLEDFFLSFNKDSDLYVGVQQGDNGQTIVLGGSNEDGSDAYNDLSELCLIASRDLCLIDPKVNLRVHKNTPLSVYELATTLTQKGLGFPQYTNDEIVIPALLRWGYEKKDAYNYTLAACWEILVTGYMDLVNWDSLNFLKTVQDACEHLPECKTYEDFAALVKQNIEAQAGALMAETKNVYKEPSPLVSLMCPDCLEKMRDISKPGKYNNYGFHGDGLATAADSMAAVRKYVYDEKTFTPETMLAMLHADFKGYEREQNMLRYEGPKFGNDDDFVDSIAVQLLDWYADALEGKKNDRGGCFRAGTASAMYYIWHSKDAPASPDGRSAHEALPCNYSPSLFARCEGPISIIKSFAKPHLTRVANGGPLTVELSDTMFRNEDAIRKCAMFVKSFMDMGGHQMQINAVNRDRLLDAQKHPENYRNLIVRVWGWSGYFVELNEVYQNHIIKRSEMSL